MESLPDWVTNEAISNYLIFFAGLLIGSIGWLKKYFDDKAQVVRVEKKSETSLIDIVPDARKRLTMMFQGETSTQLHQATYTLSNQAKQPIENIQVHFTFQYLFICL